jgi:hypothetical protein
VRQHTNKPTAGGAGQNEEQGMDDASNLGPLWVSQLRKEVASRRNRAAENLLTINPDGDFARQHRMLIEAADAMLEAQGLLTALRQIESYLDGRMTHQADNTNYPFWNQLWEIASDALIAAGAA